MKHKKIGLITLAITLISLGLLFLVNNFMTIDISVVLSVVWPSILILLGLELIIGKVMMEKNRDDQKLRLSGGSMFLILICVLGLAIISKMPINDNFQFVLFDGISNGNFLPLNYKYDSNFSEDFTIQPENRDTLEIRNAFGDIQVDRASGEDIEVFVEIEMKHNDEAYANRVAKEIVETTKALDGKINMRVRTEQFLNNKSKIKNLSVDLMVKLPKGMNLEAVNKFGNIEILNVSKGVQLENQHGDVHVESIGSALGIINSFGDVYVKGVKGDTVIENKHDDIDVEAIEGNLRIKNEYGEVEVSNITGHTEIYNKHDDVEITQVGGNAKVENEYGAIALQDVAGDIIVDGLHSKVEVDRVGGNVSIDNSYDNILVKEAHQLIDIKNRNGDIGIETKETIKKALLVDNEYGDVTIGMPRNQEGTFNIFTRHGEISGPSQFTVHSDVSEESVQKKLGHNDVEIDIRVKSGDVDLSSY